MKKELFANKKTPVGKKKVRFYTNPTNGAKFALAPASANDTSDWIYSWDKDGEYRGCANTVKNFDKLKEITKEEFLA